MFAICVAALSVSALGALLETVSRLLPTNSSKKPHETASAYPTASGFFGTLPLKVAFCALYAARVRSKKLIILSVCVRAKERRSKVFDILVEHVFEDRVVVRVLRHAVLVETLVCYFF